MSTSCSGELIKQWVTTPKIRKPELSILYATCHLILIYISTNYHQNIPKCIQVTVDKKFYTNADANGILPKNNMSQPPLVVLKSLKTVITLFKIWCTQHALTIWWTNCPPSFNLILWKLLEKLIRKWGNKAEKSLIKASQTLHDTLRCATAGLKCRKDDCVWHVITLLKHWGTVNSQENVLCHFTVSTGTGVKL